MSEEKAREIYLELQRRGVPCELKRGPYESWNILLANFHDTTTIAVIHLGFWKEFLESVKKMEGMENA